ncbi:MAG TPA: uroporphyrinogen decarboxylase family protein [Planctomycetota bacterium]|nr:uroporphyrinogen decarboxylase family protein [Planctomycetota bacterium]
MCGRSTAVRRRRWRVRGAPKAVSRRPALLAFLDRLVEHWRRSIDALVAAGVDVIYFGEDWGTQTGPLVSPDLFRDVFRPRYRKLVERVHRSGGRVFFHCCGSPGPIFDELLDLGIDGLWPQIDPFEADARQVELCRERRVAVYIHPDRQRLVPLGTPAEIDAEIRRYAERYRAFGGGGGGIFYVETENDAPFENVRVLIESVEKWR